MDKKLISLVIPVFNESENINYFYKTVNDIISQIKNYHFEFIFTDNNSTDNTFELLKQLANQDQRISIYRLSRNFGYQRSIFTGYVKAKGDALIQLDCDLQDPPQMIKDFIKAWENCYHVVYGIRAVRQENFFITKLRKIFYRLIDALCEYHLPLDAGDFRLVDRVVINELIKIKSGSPYLRGEIAHIGFRQKGIIYNRHARAYGKSKFAIRDLFKLAVDGIVSHSIVPLRIATYTSMFIATLTLLFCVICLIGHFIWGMAWPRGFATTTILILFSISLNASFLGILGEYVGRIYNQMVNRSLTIIAEEIIAADNVKYLKTGES